MARLPEYDRTEVLEAALHLFWRDGYESTTIEKLLEAMQLNRGSLYAAFGDKEGLFRNVMDGYGRYQSVIMRSNLTGKDEPIEAIRCFLEDFALHEGAEIRERGCLAFNTIAELSHTRPQLAEKASKQVGLLRRLFIKRLEQASKLGLIRVDKTAGELADYLVTLASGLRMHCKIKTEPAIMREIINLGLGVLAVPADKQPVDKQAYIQ
ncbi:MAG: hypothetical protein DRR06_02005 [Gammaproteobacteria bacterium]|nr:MAG: hypothetical protein DRR06_02005 [Gammaproteobacteria bacterium]